MHEYSLVLGLLDDIERLVRSQTSIPNDAHSSFPANAPLDPVRVHRVHVRIGELAGVDAELFRTAFTIARDGTPCAATELVLTAEAAAWDCDACGPLAGKRTASLPDRWDERPDGLRCPSCGARLRRHGGRDIVLERIELEVMHV